MKPKRSWPGVPNRNSTMSSSMVMRPKSIATVVVVLLDTLLVSSMPTLAVVMAASVVSGGMSERVPTMVVLPTPNPPAITIFTDIGGGSSSRSCSVGSRSWRPRPRSFGRRGTSQGADLVGDAVSMSNSASSSTMPPPSACITSMSASSRSLIRTVTTPMTRCSSAASSATEMASTASLRIATCSDGTVGGDRPVVDPLHEGLEPQVGAGRLGAAARHDERPDEVVPRSLRGLLAHPASTRFLSSFTSSGVSIWPARSTSSDIW